VNGQVVGAPTLIDALPANGTTAVSRTYTSQGDGIVTFTPSGSGFQGVAAGIVTTVDGSLANLVRSFSGVSVTIAVRTGQTYTVTVTAGAGATPNLGSFWTPLRNNAPKPTF
jgi:hypothetical protein